MRGFPFWQTLIGLVIIAIGIVGLLNNLGLIGLTIGQVVGVIFTLALIAIGVWLIWSARQPRHVPRSINTVAGDIDIGRYEWELRELSVNSGLGDVTIDLGKATVPGGEGRIEITTWLGDVRILVPPGYGVRARGHVWLGDLTIMGRHSSGFFRDLDFTSSDFSEAETRVVIEANQGLGDFTVARLE